MNADSQDPVDPAPTGDTRSDIPVVMSRLWYRAVLSDDLVGPRQLALILEHFTDALSAADWPDGACLFMGVSTSVDAHPGTPSPAPEEALFFSPAAIAAVPHLLVICGAGPSPPPSRAGATLLVGKPGDWNLLPRDTH